MPNVLRIAMGWSVEQQLLSRIGEAVEGIDQIVDGRRRITVGVFRSGVESVHRRHASRRRECRWRRGVLQRLVRFEFSRRVQGGRSAGRRDAEADVGALSRRHVSTEKSPDRCRFDDVEAGLAAESRRLPVLWTGDRVAQHALDSERTADVDHSERRDRSFHFLQQQTCRRIAYRLVPNKATTIWLQYNMILYQLKRLPG